MSQKRFARVGELLPTVLKSIGLGQRLKEQEVLGIWAQVVGEEIAARTQPLRVDKGVLYVRVDQSAWLQELHFMEKEILRKLKEKAPDVDLDRIRFGASK
ncbi:MAG: putative RNA-binding protein containing Zn ribbon [Candidatus Krumholzibacteriota bacterium]|nr:putative RNA-binding protein containing Zn ribbon [Candidatus Krumholzibacteriota bacterium]